MANEAPKTQPKTETSPASRQADTAREESAPRIVDPPFIVTAPAGPSTAQLKLECLKVAVAGGLSANTPDAAAKLRETVEAYYDIVAG